MLRIFIDNILENLAEKYSKDLFAKRQKNFLKPVDNLSKITNELKVKYPDYANYINKIIAEYETLNSLKPSKIIDKKEEFDKILPENLLNEKVPSHVTKNGKKTKVDRVFYELIVEAMRYDAIRDIEFMPYLKQIGIKSCVYCNSQLTIVTEKNENNEITAKLELDHHYAKSKYPFLCTSFFNLYPTCGNCNRAKSKNDADFQLYSEENIDLDVFDFMLDDESVLQYFKSRNVDDIKFKFKTKTGLKDISTDHDKMFCIHGIYDTQKDIIEELIHKKEAYSEQYKKDLVELFDDLFPDKALINRLIIGNYANTAEIHKRPMSKFTQDIAKDLKLIKNSVNERTGSISNRSY